METLTGCDWGSVCAIDDGTVMGTVVMVMGGWRLVVMVQMVMVVVDVRRGGLGAGRGRGWGTTRPGTSSYGAKSLPGNAISERLK